MMTTCSVEHRGFLTLRDSKRVWLTEARIVAGACVVQSGLPADRPANAGPQVDVKHTPYLQLGNAVLDGLPGAQTDQIEIIWQTVPGGAGTADSFTLEYRETGAGAWTAAGPISTITTGVGGRVNHFVTIGGVRYKQDYDHRVIHDRAGGTIATYEATFRTRLPAGDQKPVTFAAYGDSAALPSIQNFRAVQNRINLIDPDFSVLLGDNAYNSGSHTEFDTRFEPAINPDLTQYIANHVDYYAMGNHDQVTAGGQPSLDNYSVPVPVVGTTSALPPPLGETPEKNYSFD